MKSILNFIQSFIDRSGNYIFLSTVCSRVLSFLASWIALQLIDNQELGIVIYAYQIILFINPIANFGVSQSLIRYSPLIKSVKEKKELYNFIFRRGIILCFVSILITILIAFIYPFENSKIKFYLSLLSISFVTKFLFDVSQIQLRIFKKNRLYAIVDFWFNFVLIILVFILSYYFGAIGYAIALISAPLLTYAINFKKYTSGVKRIIAPKVIDFSFWRYGFFAGLSNVTTNMLIAIDLILIGNIMSNMKYVTAFKYVSLVPFSVIILSQILITTDFVTFTEKINQRLFIKNYIKNYVKLFTFISVLFMIFITLFGKNILYLFQNDYVEYFNTLLILSLGVCGILILRGIFGNLLSSIGKAHINFFITFVAIGLNYLSNIFLIPKYGIEGAAITTASLMWLTSFACTFLFYYYYNKYDKTTKIS